MKPVIDPTVFVIESLADRDIRDGRSEGEALSAALRLACITSHYFNVKDLQSLTECLTEIGRLTVAKKKCGGQDMLTVPHLHFSAHGNEDGLALTGGDFVPWAGLRIMLLGLGKATGYIGPSGYCLFLATFSACDGAFARQMFVGEPPPEIKDGMFGGKAPKPCIGVVGPAEPVTWSDSLTAFVTFYHLNLVKDVPAQAAVSVMNQAAGLTNVFRCFAHNDVASH